MPNTAQTKFTENDNTLGTSPLLKGVIGVIGFAKRGPIGRPDILITSPTQFVQLYGNEVASSQCPTLILRALARGAAVRFSSVKNGALQADLTTTGSFPQDGGSAAVFTGKSKYPGSDYNNLKLQFLAGSNGQTGYWDLRIYHNTDPEAKAENYPNLKFSQTDWMTKVNEASQLVVLTGFDPIADAALGAPTAGVYGFTGGSDGSTITTTHYIGTSSNKQGVFAFDAITDVRAIGLFEELSTVDMRTVQLAMGAYTDARKDMVTIIHINNSINTPSAVATERALYTLDSTYIAFYCGGVKPLNSLYYKEVSEIGDVMGALAYSHRIYGEWWSFAGTNRGLIYNALGVVNNFGAGGSITDLQFLATRQVNCVIQSDGVMNISGNFTGQLVESQLSYLSIRFLMIFIKLSLSPLLKKFQEEPLDIHLFRLIHSSVKPFFEDLKSEGRRAIFDYSWQGDQKASTIKDLQINTGADISAGRYKVKLYIQAINSLREIEIEMTLSRAGVSIQEVEQ